MNLLSGRRLFFKIMNYHDSKLTIYIFIILFLTIHFFFIIKKEFYVLFKWYIKFYLYASLY
jgi:hypothetical protein